MKSSFIHRPVWRTLGLGIAALFLIASPAFTQVLTFVEFKKDGMGGVDGLDGARGVTVSPDGKHVYVTGQIDDAVAVFSRDGATGVLTFVEFKKDGVGGVDGLAAANGVTVSPDGNHVYVAGAFDDAVAVFSRDATTGALTFVEFKQDGVGGADGLNGATGVTVSPDGKHVYVTGAFDDAVAVFSRDATTGALTFVEFKQDGVGGVDGLAAAFGVTVSPDGKHVYVTGFDDNAVAVFSRDATTGALTFVEFKQNAVGGVGGLEHATGVTVSPDGKHVYVAGQADDAVAVFSRDAATGALTFVQFKQDGLGGVDGLAGAFDVTVSPDGKHVYVAGQADNAVAVFSRNATTGALTFVEFKKDGVGGVDGLAAANGVTVSPDGNHVYVTGFVDDAVAVFSLNPEMDVLGNSFSIADGDVTPSLADHTDFGSANITGGSVDRVFTIANLGKGDLNLTGSPLVEITGAQAADFSVIVQPVSPVAPSGSTTFTVRFDPSAIGLRSATISIPNNDANENPYDFAIQGTGTSAPEMDVLGNSFSIADGDVTPSAADHTDFGSADLTSGSVDRIFTIANLGNGDLNLTGSPLVQITGAHAADFSVIEQPSSPVAPGGSTTFTVRFDPSAVGLRSATISIANNDADENPYDFAIQGTGVPSVKSFVFLANKVTLKSTKQAPSYGDIHSNSTLTVEKGKPSTYNSNLTAVGKITINKENTINGDVTSQTSISNSGTINGTASIGAVDSEPLPSLSYSAGGDNKTVPGGGALAVAPGSYNIVTLNAGGTLQLESGEYFMNELRYPGSEAVIEIDLSSGDPVTINVVSKLQLGKEVEIRLLPNGESDSELVTFNTLQSTSVSFGKEAYLLGSFNAPNAMVTLVKNSQLRGAICANEILVSNDCLFLHHDSPGSLPGPGNLPKSSVDDEKEATSNAQPATSYQLEQNYPNPFNPSTVISFQLPVTSDVTLSIFNTNGQLVKKLVAGEMNAGRHSFTWDARDERGLQVASGVYLYVIKAANFTAQRKLVLMK
jgi:6-phosphogluconolactonase (cycloisomerase 2 family)